MKKRLFTVCILAISFWSFSTDLSYAATGDIDDGAIIPPVIIRPPVNKQKLMYHHTLFIDKSTFVDISFEA